MLGVGADEDGRPHEVALAVVGGAAGDDLERRVGAGHVQHPGQLGEGTVVDDGAHEVGQVGDVTHGEALDLRDEVVAEPGPQRAGDVGAGGGGALLALELEGSPDEGGAEGVDVGGGVGEDEVLAAGLADDPRVAAVVGDVGADRAPQVLEGGGGAGEVDAGQVGLGEGHLGDVQAVTGDEVDDARRETGRLQQPHGEVRGEALGGRGLPHDRVAHQGGGGGEVAGDGGEVEGRDRVDEALQRPVVHPVPHAGGAAGLLGEDVPAVLDVEAPEVGELAGGVDLGLDGGLRLAEHGGGVEGGTPGAAEQVGGAQQHGGAVVVAEGAPAGGGLAGGLDGVGGVLLGGVAEGAEHVAVVVRLHDVDPPATAHPLFTADGERQLAGLGGQLGQLRLQLRALGGARRVGEDRFVLRRRNVGDGVHRTAPSGGGWIDVTDLRPGAARKAWPTG